MPSFL